MPLIRVQITAVAKSTTYRHQTCLLTYLLTPHSTVLLEKLTGLQLVKKFPPFYGTRRFITSFTNSHPKFLSWASSIQSTPRNSLPKYPSFYCPPIYAWVSPAVSFPQASPPKPCTHLPLPHPGYMPRPPHSYRFYHPHNIGWGIQITKLLIMTFPPLPLPLYLKVYNNNNNNKQYQWEILGCSWPKSVRITGNPDYRRTATLWITLVNKI
jgi:hypothetical protein